MMKLKKASMSVILALVATLALVLAYTNCAKSFTVPSLDLPENSNLGTGDVIVEMPVLPNGSFKTGDNFDRALMGTTLTPGLKAMLDQYGFEAYTFRKAIAVSINGIGYASYRETASIAENDRVAVEACNILSSAPCALIVSDGKFLIDGDKIAASAKMLVSSAVGLLDPALVPLTTNPAQIASYLNSTSPGYPFKALAISPDGRYFWQFGKTQIEANRRSLNRCELDASITPCLIYAEGSQKTFVLASWNRVSTLRLAPALVTQETLPFILDEDRAKTDGFFKTVADGYVGVTAIGFTGSYSYQVDVTTEVAREKALASCRASDPSCFVYSEMKNVVLSWDTLASRDVPRDAICGLPRAGCADHKERGCPAGIRWVLVGAGLGRVRCD